MDSNSDLNSKSGIAERNLTSDEKLLAMLAHLSIFLGGIILPIILWATQKDKSKFVTFNSLQAIVYHFIFAFAILIFVFAIMFVLIISGIGLGAFGHSHGSHEGTPVFVIIMLVILYGGIFFLAMAGVGYAIYLAVKSHRGNLVKIPVIGKIIYRHVYGDQ